MCVFKTMFLVLFSILSGSVSVITDEATPELPAHLLALFPIHKSYLIDLESNLGMEDIQAVRKRTVQSYCDSIFHRHDFTREGAGRNPYSIYPKHNISECRLAKTGECTIIFVIRFPVQKANLSSAQEHLIPFLAVSTAILARIVNFSGHPYHF